MEIICNCFAPYPGLQNENIVENYTDRGVLVNLNVNVLLLSIGLIVRLYLFIRFILSFSRYMNTRMQRLCHINGTSSNFMYALKCWKNDAPYSFICTALIIPVIICAYSLRMFERPLIPTSLQDFNSMWNCGWCIIITVTTVGYGDYFPISNCGRVVGILACLWGTFVVSIFVVTLNNLLEFSQQEMKSYEIMVKLAQKDQLRMKAISVILSAQRNKVERQRDDLEIR